MDDLLCRERKNIPTCDWSSGRDYYRPTLIHTEPNFFCASKIVLNKDTYNRCEPIALEFCKWLCRVAGTCVPLYKVLIGFKDIFSFVKEQVVKLSHDLLLSTESTPLLSDVRDFSVFLVLVRKKIERYVVIELWPHCFLLQGRDFDEGYLDLFDKVPNSAIYQRENQWIHCHCWADLRPRS
ncbi:hypothetical protein ACJIZ3_000516 [Penstemon smallii]|uniref:Uncharacterized protein n=1 Tax=Penstemon smallii TaxID=265156 RepID=A0ABD3R1H2_9LAMI